MASSSARFLLPPVQDARRRAARRSTRSSCASRSSARLFHKTALSRFSSTLAMLLVGRRADPAGARHRVRHREQQDRLEAVATCSRACARVSRSPSRSRKHAVFPPMVVQMIAVGEETGQVDTMLEKVAQFYDQEVEASVDALTSLIEPLLIAVIGGVRRRRGHRALHADVQHHQADQVAVPQFRTESPGAIGAGLPAVVSSIPLEESSGRLYPVPGRSAGGWRTSALSRLQVCRGATDNVTERAPTGCARATERRRQHMLKRLMKRAR